MKERRQRGAILAELKAAGLPQRVHDHPRPMVGRFGAGAVTAREASPRFDVYTQTIAPKRFAPPNSRDFYGFTLCENWAQGGGERPKVRKLEHLAWGAGELVRKQATAGEPYYPTMYQHLYVSIST